MLNASERLFAYQFDGYWKDVGTIDSLWEANMDLLNPGSRLDLSDDKWKIYSRSLSFTPHYIAKGAIVKNSLISDGCSVYGTVESSILFPGVHIEKGAIIRDSIIMNQTQIGDGCEINKAIIAENVVVGNQVKLGVGEEAENDTAPHIYNHGLVTIGEKSVIPDGISVGKNSVISGVTAAADYEDSQLASGKTLIKAGE